MGDELVERLEEEALRLQGRGIDRGCVDSYLSGSLAQEAADRIDHLLAEIARWQSAVAGIADDYVTSETHHPGYVLIPTRKFNELAALQPSDTPKEDI